MTARFPSAPSSTGNGGGPETDPVASPALVAHAADTTDVHGIADTGLLATDAELAAAVAAHEADTTGVHGITDTASLLVAAAGLPNPVTGWFHVTAYGATLDGVTDDGPAFNAAIDAALAAGGGTVYVPNVAAGVAIIGTKITLKSNVELRIGASVTVQRKPTGFTGNMIVNAATVPLRTVADGAITAGTATLTSATAAFTAADVGRSISVTGAGDPANALLASSTLFGYISSVIDASTAVLSLNAVTTVTGATVKVMGRDSNIAITGEQGATLDYGDIVTGQQSTGGANTYLRNVDGVRIQNLRVLTVPGTGGGKFAFYLHACTKVRAENIEGHVQSAIVQFNGKTKDVLVRNVWGDSGDDSVAFVQPDRGGLVDGDFGDMEDIVVENVNTVAAASTNGIKLLPGTYMAGTASAQQIVMRNVRVSGVRGSHGGKPITVGLVSVATPSPYTGGVVDGLTVEDSKPSNQTQGVAFYNITARNVTIRNLNAVTVNGGAVVEDMLWEKTYIQLASNAYAVVLTNASGGSGTSAGAIGSLRFKGCRLKAAGLVNNQTVGTITTLHVDDHYHESGAWVLGDFATAVIAFVRGLRSLSQTGLVHMTATGSVDLREFSGQMPASDFTAVAGGTMRSKSIAFPCALDRAGLQKNNGDLIYNTKATLTPLSGTAAGLVGPCVCDGTVWKNLATGSTF